MEIIILMKKIFALFFSLAVSLTAFPIHAEGVSLNASNFVADESLLEFAQRVRPLQHSLATVGTAIARGTKSAATRAPAPPLTYLESYAVISSNHPTYEYLSQSQFSTIYDHGGAEMYVVTVELGYGGNPIAQLNGSYLSQIDSLSITDAGGTIIGWYRLWNANGHQSGQFTYQNTSINSPWNTMSDWVMIQ